MRSRIAIVCIFTAMALLLTGCAAGAPQSMAEESGRVSYSASADYAAVEAPAAEAAPMEPQAAGVYDSGSGAAKPQYGNHKIITNYNLEMETEEFDLHLEMLQDKAAALGGYVENSSVNGSKPVTYRDPGRYASFTFRIPSENAAEFVEFTKGTGVITYSNVGTRDVTLEYFDSETRLDVLRTQLDRLTSILVETDNLADIIALEQEIARVTMEIEQLTTELRKYDDLIDYTTVSVGINERQLAMAPADELTMGQRISRGFSENLHSMRIFLEDSIVWIVVSLPAILLIAALLLLVVWAVKFLKKFRIKAREKTDARRAAAREKMQRIATGEGQENENGKR